MSDNPMSDAEEALMEQVRLFGARAIEMRGIHNSHEAVRAAYRRGVAAAAAPAMEAARLLNVALYAKGGQWLEDNDLLELVDRLAMRHGELMEAHDGS